jgi:CheY-like chemotaxis protein
MTDDPAASGGPDLSWAGPIELLRRLSLRTKAIVISSEYTRRQMEPAELRRILEVLAPTPEEQANVILAVEEELRAARYPMGEVVRLVSGLTSQGDAAEVHPPESGVIITRKVRSPNLMPFESFEFESPRPEAEGPAGEEPGDEAADVVEAPAGDVARGFRFVSGGEPAPPSGEGLAGMGARCAPSPGGESGDGGRPTVLVADDDARARMMYRAKLEESGFLVVEAKDGIEAWDHIRNGVVHCAVMDMKMPGYHGLEILGRMVDANLIVPVVVVSAFDQLGNEFVVATYPMLEFLAKPASPERIVEAVNSFLRPGKRVQT